MQNKENGTQTQTRGNKCWYSGISNKKKKTEEKFNNKFSNITEENSEKKPVNLFLFSYFPEWCVQEIYTAK